MKLSILTPTIPERSLFNHFNGSQKPIISELQEKLALQIKSANAYKIIEHLILCDNRTRTIGAKRQALVDIARGDYVAFVDDDDDVSDDYIACLLEAIESGADVITFRQRAIYNGMESEVIFGGNHQDGEFKPDGYTIRGPWHVCAWKRSKIVDCVFPESNYGEDLTWCLQARQKIKTAFHVDRVLHTYCHDAGTTAAPEPGK